MKIPEERYLASTINNLNKYIKDKTNFLDFYNNLDNLEVKPLQDLSFKSDLEYFKEISFILSVITSIVAHPHISSKTEDIIIRTSLASEVSPSDFNKTLRDPSLWNEDGLEMIPEYVHYHQSIDEYRIYENIFIVNLIKFIDFELKKYTDFYITRIPTFNGQSSLNIDLENSIKAFKEIGSLNRRIRRIKNTYFYKVVSRGKTNLRSIHPTNILLKDRLYNYCFKFYKKIITYTSIDNKELDFRSYYYILILKELKKLGFTSDKASVLPLLKNEFNLSLTILHNDLFNITIEPVSSYNALKITIDNIYVNNPTVNLLLFDSTSTFEALPSVKESYYSIEALSVWNKAIIEDKVKVNNEILSETGLVKSYLDSKMSVALINEAIYSKYCPICKSQSLDIINNEYICSDCGSSYIMYKDKLANTYCWFRKIRR